MLRNIAWCVVMAVGFAGCSERTTAPAVSPDVANVQAIRVDYQYMGWGFTQEGFTLMPAGNGSDFILLRRLKKGGEPHDTGKRVPRGAVEELLATASASAWSRERGVRAVAGALRHDGVTDARPFTDASPDACTPQQLKRVARAFVRRRGIVSLTDVHYGQGLSWTDDYPYIRLEIHFRDSPPLRMYSDSQKPMMLPWYSGAPSDSPPASDQNWSVALSHALQGVLPSDSSAYERLGIEHERHLRFEIESLARQECDAMRAQGQSSLRKE